MSSKINIITSLFIFNNMYIDYVYSFNITLLDDYRLKDYDEAINQCNKILDFKVRPKNHLISIRLAFHILVINC